MWCCFRLVRCAVVGLCLLAPYESAAAKETLSVGALINPQVELTQAGQYLSLLQEGTAALNKALQSDLISLADATAFVGQYQVSENALAVLKVTQRLLAKTGLQATFSSAPSAILRSSKGGLSALPLFPAATWRAGESLVTTYVATPRKENFDEQALVLGSATAGQIAALSDGALKRSLFKASIYAEKRYGPLWFEDRQGTVALDFGPPPAQHLPYDDLQLVQEFDADGGTDTRRLRLSGIGILSEPHEIVNLLKAHGVQPTDEVELRNTIKQYLEGRGPRPEGMLDRHQYADSRIKCSFETLAGLLRREANDLVALGLDFSDIVEIASGIERRLLRSLHGDNTGASFSRESESYTSPKIIELRSREHPEQSARAIIWRYNVVAWPFRFPEANSTLDFVYRHKPDPGFELDLSRSSLDLYRQHHMVEGYYHPHYRISGPRVIWTTQALNTDLQQAAFTIDWRNTLEAFLSAERRGAPGELLSIRRFIERGFPADSKRYWADDFRGYQLNGQSFRYLTDWVQAARKIVARPLAREPRQARLRYR